MCHIMCRNNAYILERDRTSGARGTIREYRMVHGKEDDHEKYNEFIAGRDQRSI